ncbi:MAG: hypothetical protein V4646_16145 [Pseudomonadota bacterium]
MNTTRLILAAAIVALSTLLAGCTDPEVKAVKASRHWEDTPPYGTILDRADCGSLNWAVPTDDNGYKYVTATCTLSRSTSSEVKEQAIALADKRLNEEVKRNKYIFTQQFKSAQERVGQQAQQFAGQDPSSISAYALREYNEEASRLEARKKGVDAYMAEVDARKEKELQRLKTLLDSGSLAAEYYFQVRGEQGRLRGMSLIVGDKKIGAGDGEYVFSMARLAKRDLAAERVWWAQRLSYFPSLQSIQNCSYLEGCM